MDNTCVYEVTRDQFGFLGRYWTAGEKYTRGPGMPKPPHQFQLVSGTEPPEPEGEKKDTGEGGFPKHTGGGMYELSNGEKVKGKDAAFAAEKALQEQSKGE